MQTINQILIENDGRDISIAVLTVNGITQDHIDLLVKRCCLVETSFYSGGKRHIYYRVVKTCDCNMKTAIDADTAAQDFWERKWHE